jgi:hypothetical protein
MILMYRDSILSIKKGTVKLSRVLLGRFHLMIFHKISDFMQVDRLKVDLGIGLLSIFGGIR